MTDVAELGVSVDSRSAVVAVTHLDKLVSAAGRAESSVDKLGKSSTAAATDMQKMVNSVTGVGDEFKDAAASAEVFEASLNEQRAAFEALRMSIDPVYASSMRYAEAIDQIAIAQQLGVISAREAEAAFRAADTRFLAVGTSAGELSRATRMTSNDLRMLGFQLSQVAQQGMATGQWATALSIQAADIGASFGLIGLVVGTLTTIALPTLVSWMSSSTSESQTFEDALDKLRASMDELQSSTQNYTSSGLVGMKEKYGELNAEIMRHIDLMRQVDMREAMQASKDTIESLSQELSSFWDSQFNNLQDLFDLSRSETIKLWAELERAKKAGTFEDQARSLTEIRDRILEATGGIKNMTTEQLSFYTKVQDSLDSMIQLSESAANTGWLSGMINEAQTLAGSLWEAVSAKWALAEDQQYESLGDDERGSQRAQLRSGGEFVSQQAQRDNMRKAALAMGGGASKGGGGSDEYSPRLQALLEELQQERDIEEEWYQESLQILEDRRATELLTEAEHKEAMIALEEEYQNRLRQIDMEARQRKLSETAGLFGALADLASVGGKKTAKAVAAFQAIEGTINAYGAAIKALNTPGITLAGRFAAYASVLAAGLKGVMAIKSAGGAVGGGGGSTSAGTLPATAAQAVESKAAPQSKTVVLGLRPEDLFTGKMIYEMFLAEADLRGGVNVELIGV